MPKDEKIVSLIRLEVQVTELVQAPIPLLVLPLDVQKASDKLNLLAAESKGYLGSMLDMDDFRVNVTLLELPKRTLGHIKSLVTKLLGDVKSYRLSEAGEEMLSLEEDRKRVIKFTYDWSKTRPQIPVGNETIANELDLSVEVATESAQYWVDKGYLEIVDRTISSFFVRINADGQKLVETNFKPSMTELARINVIQTGDVYGNIIQASEGNINAQVTNRFAPVYDALDVHDGLSEEQKTEIKAILKELEQELSSQSNNTAKIKEIMDILKEKTSWLLPMLSPIIVEAIKKGLGL